MNLAIGSEKLEEACGRVRSRDDVLHLVKVVAAAERRRAARIVRFAVAKSGEYERALCAQIAQQITSNQ